MCALQFFNVPKNIIFFSFMAGRSLTNWPYGENTTGRNIQKPVTYLKAHITNNTIMEKFRSEISQADFPICSSWQNNWLVKKLKYNCAICLFMNKILNNIFNAFLMFLPTKAQKGWIIKFSFKKCNTENKSVSHMMTCVSHKALVHQQCS